MQNIDEEEIECTKHTLFRLSQKQRQVFNCEELKRILLHETPIRVGVQYNGNYAIYYRSEKRPGIIKIIINIGPAKISM